MTQQYTPNIGGIPDDTARRDAIHIPVAPVVAGVGTLKPGDRVYLSKKDRKAYHADDQSDDIGIVDPFLTEPLEKDQKFWLFLYPGTITGLRHLWSHPAFDTKLVIDRGKV